MTCDLPERFDSSSGLTQSDLQIELMRYLPVRNLVKASKILDIGCGSGFSSNLLLDWGASSVVGVDVDRESINLGKKLYSKPNLTLLEGYAEQIQDLVDLKDFDGICIVECIEHVIDPGLVLTALQGIIGQGTWVYITAPNDYWNFRFEKHDNPHHLRKFTKTEFLQLTSSYLGNPFESGEGHAFLGFSVVSDSLEEEATGKNFADAVSTKSGNSLNSDDAIFFYSLWGNSGSTPCIVGSPSSMSIYTKLFDANKLKLSVSEISEYAEREIAFKLQETTEALVESQNKLMALKILIESLEESGTNLWDSEKFNVNIQEKKKPFVSLVSTPPRFALSLFQILPTAAKNLLRDLRRRYIRQ